MAHQKPGRVSAQTMKLRSAASNAAPLALRIAAFLFLTALTAVILSLPYASSVAGQPIVAGAKSP